MKAQGLMIHNDYFAFSLKLKYINGQDWKEATLGSRLFSRMLQLKSPKGAGTFHSASQSKEGSVGFGTSQHPIFMKLLPDQLWH